MPLFADQNYKSDRIVTSNAFLFFHADPTFIWLDFSDFCQRRRSISGGEDAIAIV